MFNLEKGIFGLVSVLGITVIAIVGYSTHSSTLTDKEIIQKLMKAAVKVSSSQAMASGLVINTKLGPAILSAKHFCLSAAPTDVLKNAETTDLCLLNLPDELKVETSPIDLASKAPEPGDTVYMIAFPLGSKKFNKGYYIENVSVPVGADGMYSPEIDAIQQQLGPFGAILAAFTSDIRYSVSIDFVMPGSSGGGLVNARGDLVAVATEGRPGAPFDGRFVGLDKIREFLDAL